VPSYRDVMISVFTYLLTVVGYVRWLSAGKESHSGGMENLLSASSLAETHISPDDLPPAECDEDDGTLR